MSKMILVFVVVALLGGIWWNIREVATPSPSLEQGQEEPIRVVATFYPLQQFTEAVVGDQGTVTSVVPAGIEPHEYEPSAQDIKNIYDADLFVLNGAGLDPWAEKIMPDLEKKGVHAIRFSDQVELLPGSEEEEEHAEKLEPVAAGSLETHSEGWDPHFWLDPVLVEEEIRNIEVVLSDRFPEKKRVFETNRDRFLEELYKLDIEYKTGLSMCRLHTVVTAHNAFSYLGKRYGFAVHSISGVSPEIEPSPRHLTELSTLIKKEGIHYVFFETLVSPSIAETLAHSAGIETLVFNPLEGVTDEEKAAGKNYSVLMRENLSTLQKALECK